MKATAGMDYSRIIEVRSQFARIEKDLGLDRGEVGKVMHAEVENIKAQYPEQITALLGGEENLADIESKDLRGIMYEMAAMKLAEQSLRIAAGLPAESSDYRSPHTTTVGTLSSLPGADS